MLIYLKRLLQITKIFWKKKNYFNFSQSQNDNKESLYLLKLSKIIKNKIFVEFGFHYFQFNCVGLLSKNFQGYLIDSGKLLNIIIMNLIAMRYNLKIKALQKHIDKKNITKILPKKFGILSIDIDGNDFWVLKSILKKYSNIEVIVLEYNSTFGHRSITTKYDANFNRHKYSKNGYYHGASLKAFNKLLSKNNFALIKIIKGLNAFFINTKIHKLKSNNLISLSPTSDFEENYLRNKWSKKNALEQFKEINHLKFINI